MLRNSKPEELKKKLPISYWSKKKCICPICKKKFDREEMLSGGNRMIAGDLTDELHRNFEPSAKYGMVYPLIYKIGACPYCNAAFLWNDFETIEDRNTIEAVYMDSENREKIVNNLFPYFDLKRPRTLLDGAAMYYLALLCYEKADIKHSPTFKRAMISLRLAWLCNDLEKACPHHNYDYAAQVFYRKALFFYQQTLLKETTGEEAIANVGHLGPDIDKNYGYDGIIYLCGFLEYKYGQRDDMALRGKKLNEYKRSIARIFGLGRSSKNKPGPLLEHARKLYENISKELSANNILSEDDEDDESDICIVENEEGVSSNE